VLTALQQSPSKAYTEFPRYAGMENFARWYFLSLLPLKGATPLLGRSCQLRMIFQYLQLLLHILLEVEVTLRLMVSQSVCLCIEHPCETWDQILLPVGMLLSKICSLVSVGRPL
jgi:hypothetical protein